MFKLREKKCNTKIGKKVNFDSINVYDMVNKKEKKVNLENKFTLLFFYPSITTSICSSEVTQISKRIKEFNELEINVIGISGNNIKTLKKISEENKYKIDVALDKNDFLKKYFNVGIKVINEAHRYAILINPELKIMYINASDLHVARSIGNIIDDVTFNKKYYETKNNIACNLRR